MEDAGQVGITQPATEQGSCGPHTHLMFILNSSLFRLFLANQKGGSGLAFFFAGMGMFPAQPIINQCPRS